MLDGGISRMKQLIALVPYNLIIGLYGIAELVKYLLFLINRFTLQVFNNKARANAKMDIAWGQKLGLYPRSLPKEVKNKCVLIHCASMGEVTVSIGVIKQILDQHPDHYVVVTTNTLTGKQQLYRKLSAEYQQRVFHTYLPLDLPWMMSALLRNVKPLVTLIVEVELWPNLIRKCKSRDIPVIIINARMTETTLQSYKKVSWLSKPMIAAISRVIARNQADYDGYKSLGFPEQNIQIVGNLKFDIELPDESVALQKRAQLNLDERIVFIAGSTHLDEEEVVINAYKKLKFQFPELILLVAPRHPDRFHQVLEYLIVQDVNVIQRSLNEEITDKTDVVLIDVMGELSTLYGASDFAFVGGSIADKGGHNPLEASVYSKPVIMGPHVYNNPEVCAELQQVGGLAIANSEEEFYDTVQLWCENKEVRSKVGKAGRQAIESHAELTSVIAKAVYEIVEKPVQ